MVSVPSSLHDIINGLPDGLQRHLYGTRDTALDLARRFGVDAAKVELAALGHDLYRAVDDAQLLIEARALGLAVHPVEERVPVLLHGPLAAEQLRRDCGVDDPDVLEAVRWHSIACAGMGEVGLVVFLADKLEPGKAGASSYLRRAAELAQESLEEAVLYCLTAEMGRLLERGGLLHPASVEARNDLTMRLGAGDR
jgi:predicted HD superfamily hydrolase involved in NAD metabolism